jgi:hypothetical protein
MGDTELFDESSVKTAICFADVNTEAREFLPSSLDCEAVLEKTVLFFLLPLHQYWIRELAPP